ncbi:mechanosensitive ion channel family protein [Mucilaginibacter daejeonensis]|uniref:mechanosensitive ion channel family protein n=1 Tax=Mucilaginibacter daejeonensis TaxID=398049 RepID=UPI001D178C02|nr:mechanosensitive ion channel domain-containing protein [Mucilaginibacter daejeonensis]UEG53843.1 mechanosensitive ion channel family protein [Mucilaginibacter daejeonensis]
MPIFYRAFLIFLFTYSGAVSAQTDTVAKRADSTALNTAVVNEQLSRLQQLQAEHVADSLKKIALQEELKALKTNDANRRSSLLRELDDLKGQDSVRIRRQRSEIDSLRRYVAGEPVVFFNDTLMRIYSRQGSFSAKERAAAVVQRIDKIGAMHFFSPDSLKIVNAEQTIDLQYGNTLIMSISELDALWAGIPKTALAQRYRAKIIAVITAYNDATSWRTLLTEAALALAVIAGAILLIYLLQKASNWSERRITALKGTLIKGLRIKNYELLTADRSVGVLIVVANLIKWILAIVVVYLALPLLFGIFPWTEGYSVKLIGYFLTPVKNILKAIWAYIPNLITIIVLVVVFKYIIRFLRFLKDEVERGVLKIPGFYTDWANPTFQIIRIMVLAFMLIVVFPYLPGSGSPIFKGVSVFVGVLFTFGSAGALGNVVAGLVLTYMRAFRIGDRVKIADATGDIIERSLLVTRIRTIKNEVISIPNSMVMSNHTVNFTVEAETKGLIIHKTVTIGYDIPWQRVHELLLKAATKTTLIEPEPKPFVLQTSLEDFYVAYEINAYTKHASKQAVIYSELYQNVLDIFHEAGIEVMSPHFHAVRDGSVINIPTANLPKDYVAPGIKIDSSGSKKG